MGNSLEVHSAELRTVGGSISAAPERSAVGPAAGVPAPAADPVSVQAAHAFATRLARIGARSATVAARVRAAGDLVQADADAYAEQEIANTRGLDLGGAPASSVVAAPHMAAVAPAVPQLPRPESATSPTDGKDIADLVHRGPGETALDEAARSVASHAADLHDTAAALVSHSMDLASVWRSDASANAQWSVERLAGDHSTHGDDASALAQRMRAQATAFQELRRDVPKPEKFEEVERQLRYAEAASRINPAYGAAALQKRAELAELNRQATTAYASYTTSTEENIAAAPFADDDGTIQLVDYPQAPPEDVADEGGEEHQADADAGKPDPEVPGGHGDTKGSEGTLADLFEPDTAPEGTPGDGEPTGLPPALNQLPPRSALDQVLDQHTGNGQGEGQDGRYTKSPLTGPYVAADPSVVERQAARVDAARQDLDAAQAKVDAAAGQTSTQGAGVGPGRDVTDPLSQALFEARRELTTQTTILNDLNQAAAEAGGRPVQVPALPEDAHVQAIPPPPSEASQAAEGLSDASHDISEATFGLVPDYAKTVDVFSNWGEHSGADQAGAVADVAGSLPLPGAKFLGEGVNYGLDALRGTSHHLDDVPTPHADVDDIPGSSNGSPPASDVPHHTSADADGPGVADSTHYPNSVEGGSTYESRLGQTPINNGHWDGLRGESRWVSDNPDVNRYLHEAGVSGIEYRNGYPDFGPVAKGEVEIPNMTTSRARNFNAADEMFATESGMTPKEVAKWRSDNGYTWHEEPDLKTMQLVPSVVNNRLGHVGGIGELNAGKTIPPIGGGS